jgi:hypothetical protein
MPTSQVFSSSLIGRAKPRYLLRIVNAVRVHPYQVRSSSICFPTFPCLPGSATPTQEYKAHVREELHCQLTLHKPTDPLTPVL